MDTLTYITLALTLLALYGLYTIGKRLTALRILGSQAVSFTVRVSLKEAVMCNNVFCEMAGIATPYPDWTLEETRRFETEWSKIIESMSEFTVHYIACDDAFLVKGSKNDMAYVRPAVDGPLIYYGDIRKSTDIGELSLCIKLYTRFIKDYIKEPQRVLTAEISPNFPVRKAYFDRDSEKEKQILFDLPLDGSEWTDDRYGLLFSDAGWRGGIRLEKNHAKIMYQ